MKNNYNQQLLLDLFRAYFDTRKNKRKTANALAFEAGYEEKIFKLYDEIINRKYKIGQSICFMVQKPVKREIFAADFRDRVVHHILVDYLERMWEKIFIYDSYACRKEKGTHRAVLRLQSFIRKVSKNGKARSYYLQLDIKSFFINIDKEILFSLIRRRTRNKDVLWLAEVIIFHDCTKNYI